MRTLSLSTDQEAWEAYRLHQRDILLACYEDAELMLKRRKWGHTDDDVRHVVALLFEKRCQPWKYFRDEWRAQLRR